MSTVGSVSTSKVDCCLVFVLLFMGQGSSQCA